MSKSLMVLALYALAASSMMAQTLPRMRMTPAEVKSSSFTDSKVGNSGVAGVQTKVLYGDPTKASFYTILLFVPPHTTIQAHSHRDNRMAAVLTGEWHFGYGDHFDEKSLKTLPQGSVYSEPGGTNHFARTGDTTVIVEISGYGPTNTRYFDPANDPALQQKK